MESGNPSEPLMRIAKAGEGDPEKTAELLQNSFEKTLSAEDKPSIAEQQDVEIGGDQNSLKVEGDQLSVKPQIQN